MNEWLNDKVVGDYFRINRFLDERSVWGGKGFQVSAGVSKDRWKVILDNKRR